MSERIIEVAGRWARLSSGDLITAIPAFHDFGFDEGAFDRAIAEFKRDPAGYFVTYGIRERLKVRKVSNQETSRKVAP